MMIFSSYVSFLTVFYLENPQKKHEMFEVEDLSPRPDSRFSPWCLLESSPGLAEPEVPCKLRMMIPPYALCTTSYKGW